RPSRRSARSTSLPQWPSHRGRRTVVVGTALPVLVLSAARVLRPSIGRRRRTAGLHRTVAGDTSGGLLVLLPRRERLLSPDIELPGALGPSSADDELTRQRGRTQKPWLSMPRATLNLLRKFSRATAAVSSTTCASEKCRRASANSSSVTFWPVIVMASAKASAARSGAE